MPGIWQGRHRLSLCWLGCRQALCPGQKTWAERAPWTPASLTGWRFRRWRTASSGSRPRLVAWWAAAALPPLPPPPDGTLHLGGDGRENPQRGTHKPLAPKGRNSAPPPGFWGMRLALVLATWEVERLPGAWRLLRPPSPPADPTEQARCRAMGGSFVPPPWAKRMIVEGAAAYGSPKTRPLVRKREADEPARRGGLGWAMARTGHTVAAKARKDLGTHGPRLSSQRLRGPRLPGTQGCTTCWVSSTRRGRRHGGDGTGVLRNKGRHGGPPPPKILGPTLDEWTPRQVGWAEQRRGPGEPSNRELKTARGRGAHQVRREEGRLETSLGMAGLASWLLIRACHQEILPGTAWSIAPLQHALR